MPTTIENDEIVLQLSRDYGDCATKPCDSNERGKAECLVLVHEGPFGNDVQMSRMLVTHFQEMGYAAYTGFSSSRASFRGTILADADDSPFCKILKAVQRLRVDFADAEIVLYVNSPRINEKKDLTNAGVDKIVAKPAFW